VVTNAKPISTTDIVLTNLFFGRKAPKTDVESLSLDSIPSIEEVGWGVWNWKFPWQSVTYVDLKRHIPVGGTEGIGYNIIKETLKTERRYLKESLSFLYFTLKNKYKYNLSPL
jgi:hypothetical protein